MFAVIQGVACTSSAPHLRPTQDLRGAQRPIGKQTHQRCWTGSVCSYLFKPNCVQVRSEPSGTVAPPPTGPTRRRSSTPAGGSAGSPLNTENFLSDEKLEKVLGPVQVSAACEQHRFCLMQRGAHLSDLKVLRVIVLQENQNLFIRTVCL